MPSPISLKAQAAQNFTDKLLSVLATITDLKKKKKKNLTWSKYRLLNIRRFLKIDWKIDLLSALADGGDTSGWFHQSSYVLRTPLSLQCKEECSVRKKIPESPFSSFRVFLICWMFPPCLFGVFSNLNNLLIFRWLTAQCRWAISQVN